MQRRSLSPFTVRALRLVLLLVILPQLLRALANWSYAFFLEGDVRFDATLTGWIPLTANFLGSFSLFAGLATVIYLVFLDGLREGGEWLIALIFAYSLALLLLAVIEDPGFGLAAFSISGAASVFALLKWTKGNPLPMVAVMAAYALTIVGGMFILFTTSFPSIDSILSSLLYGLMNLGLELLLVAVAARLAFLLRRRALRRGGSRVDIAVGSRILPKGHPILLCFLLMDGLYAAILTISSLIESFALVSEYGWPVNSQEWFSLFEPYLEIAVLFAVGYAAMLLMANRLEQAFFSSNPT